LNQFDTALEFSFKSLQRLNSENNFIGVSRACTDIGIIYKKLGKYEEGLKYLMDGLRIRQEKKLKQFEITSHMEIATLYKEIKRNQEALEHLEAAERLALEVNHLTKLASIYRELDLLHRVLSDYPKALLYSDKLLELNAELHRKDSDERISRLQKSLTKEKEEEIERLRNEELKNAYDIISEKNKEIVDSIHYAKRIQTALMTTEKYFQKNLSRLNRIRN
jgi:tetratricopeptide (TPR) repeat protein